ncbi:hypothetical protein IRZ71_01810 [Flavobacterium sp. ANB]|uniref:hypothetical protein n=1 Tax=unclassified Flavobacterium TaxID=196869 RepID=UPI0012BA25D3|nr:MULTISPECIES: hypothetical protein [unclassified Flavobacterium]MBF4515055.1 hypothetical protein [Flavobacterium sp. ANB]MTD69967.1 hypothetical protein [Flavobacterium sp. LC2016-13]
MLKKILKLEGTQELTREQKQSIKGGIACSFYGDPVCAVGHHCVGYDQGGEGHCEQIKP